jgi:segregation and condensation protein B
MLSWVNMNKINDTQLKQLVEAAIFAADHPVTIDKLRETVLDGFDVGKKQINKVLGELVLDYAPRGIKLVELASGYRFQTDPALGHQLSKLWQENAPKYSRAMLETLSLIAYKQPITRGEIEEIRGVSVSSHIIKSLTERDWIAAIGHKEVPGRPALFATTKTFLDYFGLNSLDQLPSAEMFNEEMDWVAGDFEQDASNKETTISADDAKIEESDQSDQQTGPLH